MKWEIRGTKDGKQIRAKVSADSEDSARMKAEKSGVKVLSVLPLEEAAAPEPAAPAPEETALAYSAPYDAAPQESAAPEYGQPAEYAPPADNEYAAAPPQWSAPAPAAPVPYATPVGQPGAGDPSWGLALASLICGGVGSVFFCLWPLAILLGITAIGLGITAWVIAKKRNSHIRMAMAGTFVGLVPFLILGTLALGLFAVFHKASKEAEKAKAQADAQHLLDVEADKVKQADREAEDKARRAREEARHAADVQAEAERRAARNQEEAAKRLARQQANDAAKAKAQAEAEAKAKAEADKKAALDVPVAVGAEDLIKAYADNPVVADTNYKNHIVDVQGTVAKITKNSISLFAGNKKSVQCSISAAGIADIGSVKTGDKVVIHGRCTGGSGRGANVRDATITKS